MSRNLGGRLVRRSFTGRTYVSPSPASVKRYGSWSRPDIKVAMSTIIPKPELAGDDSRSHVRDASWKDQVQVAEGQDTTLIIDRLEFLLASAHSHRWYMCLGGKGIQRSFRFKTFKQTWDFMQAVAEKCKSERHHPEWWNAYNHTFIQWTTHKPLGLTMKDVSMALFCDERASSLDEVECKAPAPRKLFGSGEISI